MGTKLFDQEARGNRLPVTEGTRVIRLSERREIGDDMLVLARSLRVERDEEVFEHEEDFGPDLALIEGEGQGENEDKRAAIILSGAACLFGAIAIGEAIARGPLPF